MKRRTDPFIHGQLQFLYNSGFQLQSLLKEKHAKYAMNNVILHTCIASIVAVMMKRKKQRERERDKDRERQTKRQRETNGQRERQRQREKETET